MKRICFQFLARVSLVAFLLAPSYPSVHAANAAPANDRAGSDRGGSSTGSGELPKNLQDGDAPTANEDATADGSWPMAGANPQRTSWTSEQVPSAAYLTAH